jgi:hypothetical protein
MAVALSQIKSRWEGTMETASAQPHKIQDGWKIVIAALVCLTGVFIFLVSLASPSVEENDETPGQAPGMSSPNVPGGPANVLKDFQFVPGSAVLVDEHHVIALFKNVEKEFYAVTLFTANCDGSGCTPTELIAFSIVDKQGHDVELANNPSGRSARMGQEI